MRDEEKEKRRIDREPENGRKGGKLKRYKNEEGYPQRDR
jgi:hypothetical protein